MKAARALGALVALISLSPDAGATAFRRPFNEGIALGYGYDHNGAAAGCQDYECGGTCYNGHKGSDFPTPFGTTIVAGAEGDVTFTSGGCANVGFEGSQCGGGYGNYVRIQHADGKVTYHGHLKDGSIVVSVGDHVQCGQKIGESASSGNSSGYHHHFEVRVGVADDPYAGQCGGPASYWVAQNGYGSPPGSDCETLCSCSAGQTESQGCGNCGARTRSCDGCQWGGFGDCGGEGPCVPGQQESEPCGTCGLETRTCEGNCQWGAWGACGPPPCMPGQTETQGCGNCGTQTRGCESNCFWGGWSACGGEGVCSPGQTSSEACGDCGQTTRGCNGDCTWGGFGACGGPDPGGGNVVCDTGLPSVCAEGRVRCVEGSSACRAVSSTGAESCDGIDNDCNGRVDDGSPGELSTPPPEVAARLVDMSAPQSLATGERAWVWADFENVGASAWSAQGLWLASLGAAEGKPSALYTTGLWPAWDIAAALDRDVAPGEVGRFAFEIQAPAEASEVRERFQVERTDGSLVACPKADFEVALKTWAGPAKADSDAEPGASATEVGGCSTSGGGGSSAAALAMLGLSLALSARRRSSSTRASDGGAGAAG